MYQHKRIQPYFILHNSVTLFMMINIKSVIMIFLRLAYVLHPYEITQAESENI